MTDYLKIGKPDVCKESIPFENLVYTGQDRNGTSHFEIVAEFTPLKIHFNERTGFLSLEGSIPYFWQGHNFGFLNSELLKALEFGSEVLCTDLMEFEVFRFEFGSMVQVPTNPGYILKNHLALPNHSFLSHSKKSGELTGIQFFDRFRKVKMYNPKFSPSFQKVSKEIKATIPDFDPKRNFIRFENHVKKAEQYLQIRGLSLRRYCTDEIQTWLKSDLLETYNSIKKKGSLILPEGNLMPKGNEILVLLLAEQIPNIKQAFYQKLNELGLDRNTIKNRQSFVRDLLNRLEFIPDERIDLIPLLQESFKNNSEQTVN